MAEILPPLTRSSIVEFPVTLKSMKTVKTMKIRTTKAARMVYSPAQESHRAFLDQGSDLLDGVTTRSTIGHHSEENSGHHKGQHTSTYRHNQLGHLLRVLTNAARRNPTKDVRPSVIISPTRPNPDSKRIGRVGREFGVE